MKASNKKKAPKNIRNKHAKAMRELLKNNRYPVNAKTICLS